MSGEFTTQLFLEAAHHASIIPFGNDLVFHAMKAFGTYPMGVPVTLSIIGALLGHIFNWYVGRSLMFFEYKGRFRMDPASYERVRALFGTYGIYLLFFSWMPLLNLLPVAAGFLKLPLKKILPFVAAGLAWHYGQALL
jgi:membrane protein YqaA with SNARE-associated domain